MLTAAARAPDGCARSAGVLLRRAAPRALVVPQGRGCSAATAPRSCAACCAAPRRARRSARRPALRHRTQAARCGCATRHPAAARGRPRLATHPAHRRRRSLRVRSSGRRLRRAPRRTGARRAGFARACVVPRGRCQAGGNLLRRAPPDARRATPCGSAPRARGCVLRVAASLLSFLARCGDAGGCAARGGAPRAAAARCGAGCARRRSRRRCVGAGGRQRGGGAAPRAADALEERRLAPDAAPGAISRCRCHGACFSYRSACAGSRRGTATASGGQPFSQSGAAGVASGGCIVSFWKQRHSAVAVLDAVATCC